jgi:hypothetical protein
MALLWHDKDYSIFSAAANQTVRRGQKVEITNEQADRVNNAGVWHVERDSAKHTPRSNRTGGKSSEVAGKVGERR